MVVSGEMPATGAAAGGMPATDPPANEAEAEFRQLYSTLQQKREDVTVYMQHLERVRATKRGEINLFEAAEEANNKKLRELAQAAIKTATLREEQLKESLMHAAQFEDVIKVLDKLHCELAFSNNQSMLAGISEKLKEKHQEIVSQVVAFGNAALLSDKVDEDALLNLQKWIAQKVGPYAATLKAEATVWDGMDKEFNQSAGAKKTRDEAGKQASGATARKPSDSAKKPKTSSPENQGDTAAEADGQTVVNNAKLLQFLQGTPDGEVNERLRGVLKITNPGENQVWEVLDGNWLDKVKDELKVVKSKDQWTKILNNLFTRHQGSPLWGQVGCKFSVNPNPRKNKRGDKDPDQESLKRRKNQNTEGTSGSGTSGDGSEDGNDGNDGN